MEMAAMVLFLSAFLGVGMATTRYTPKVRAALVGISLLAPVVYYFV